MDSGGAVVIAAATRGCAVNPVTNVDDAQQLWTPFEFQAVKKAQQVLVQHLLRQCKHPFRVGYVWKAPSLVLTVRLSAGDCDSVNVPTIVHDSSVIVLPFLRCDRTRDDDARQDRN